MFNAFKARRDDPRLQTWAYIHDRARLAEITGRSGVDVVAVDCVTLARIRIPGMRVVLHWHLAQPAPGGCPDLPPALDQPPQEEARWL